MAIAVRSEAFEAGGPIPRRYSGQGEDISPPLRWSGVPAEARQLALTVEDPDAPGGTWDHWLLYNIPVVDGLKEGLSSIKGGVHPAEMREGVNSRGAEGYQGPMPPPGAPHRYLFRLYALDAELDLPPGLDKAALLKAIAGHVIGRGELTGTHQR